MSFTDLWLFTSNIIKNMGQQQTVISEPEELDESAVLVGKVKDFKASKRMRTTVNDREVVIFHHLGKFHALDLRCYRKYIPDSRGSMKHVMLFTKMLCTKPA